MIKDVWEHTNTQTIAVARTANKERTKMVKYQVTYQTTSLRPVINMDSYKVNHSKSMRINENQ